MEYNLTFKAQSNKHCRDGKRRSFYLFFLNDVLILKQKIPFEDDWEKGYDCHTGLSDVYLLNNTLYQRRSKFGVVRDVKFPISKSTLSKHSLIIPKDLKIDLKS